MPRIYGVDKDAAVITFVKPAKAKGVRVKKDQHRLAITGTQFENLLTIAYKDGFEADGKSEQGVGGQNTRAVQAYVQLAVDKLIEMRNGAAS